MLTKTALLTALVLFLGLTAPIAAGQEKVLDDFKTGLSKHWQEKSFKGETKYLPGRDGNSHFITATSNGSASGLHYEIDYSPEEYPMLSWSWKIDKTILKGDARTKEGDDYAARIYVIFPNFFFWKTRALNYVWANRLEKEQFLPNAFTANAIMIAVESGNQMAGAWLTERRNIVEDYKKAFGSPPPRVGSIAIMTDTDNTGESVTAYYGPIKILSE